MSHLAVRVFDAARQPLTEPVTVRVIHQQTKRLVCNQSTTSWPLKVQVIDQQAYAVHAYPTRHRPVGSFVVMDARDRDVALYAPLKPQDARATFPAYMELPVGFRLAVSESFYAALDDLHKAGLLNVQSAVAHVGQWNSVARVTRVAPDRLWAKVDASLPGWVSVDSRFREVSAALHEPPEGCCHAGSWKTLEPAGNLQLTFYKGTDWMILEADLDDAAGIGHVFQVLGHALTNGVTHPYDIHEILVFRQEMRLPYSLA